MHSEQLEETIAHVCSKLPKLKILTEVASTEQLQKLTTASKESKAKV